ncbi:hypothetical protein ABZ656_08470 [Streptomyces sp. NPDC007095]|uniref:hypothetical protein n=1 Tax=Streptomyces sp. NPDC007095 TaxID=3154482 RepID=UPI0033D7730A
MAFMLLGNAVLKFMFALFSLSSGFSAGKLADALTDPAVGVLISCVLLWIFARLRSRRKSGHLGAQLSPFDHDEGLRHQAFLTGTP